MKIHRTLKLGLSILSASLLISSCTKPEDKKKGVEYNSYVEQIEKNHLLVRDQIKSISDSFYSLSDTATFMQKIHDVMMLNDEIIQNDTAVPKTHKDSLVFASHMQLYMNYSEFIHAGFRIMFEELQQEPIDSQAIDSIRQHYIEQDNRAMTYFRRVKNDTKLQEFK